MAEGGNTEVGEVANTPDSPPEELLKGLLGERAGWELEPELNGLGKFANVWELETESTPGELAGVELEDSLFPKRVLYCGNPPGAAPGEVSGNTPSSCDRAAYLSAELALGAGGAALRALCCWPRPPKSTLRDLGNALKGAEPPEAEAVRLARVKLFLKVLLAEGRGRAGKDGAWLWGPMAEERDPGRCLSIPHRRGSFIGGSLKLWDREGRAVKTSVLISAGDTATGARSQAEIWDCDWDSVRVGLAEVGMAWEGAWAGMGPWDRGKAWTPGLHGPSTSLLFLLLEKCHFFFSYLS